MDEINVKICYTINCQEYGDNLLIFAVAQKIPKGKKKAT